jgi:hypothetical protein
LDSFDLSSCLWMTISLPVWIASFKWGCLAMTMSASTPTLATSWWSPLTLTLVLLWASGLTLILIFKSSSLAAAFDSFSLFPSLTSYDSVPFPLVLFELVSFLTVSLWSLRN